MPKNTSISIRMDSKLKEQAECVLEQFGLNMTVVINMLFHQIVREQAIPLSLSLNNNQIINELIYAKADRAAGYNGRNAYKVAEDMERVIIEAKNDKKKI